MGVDHSACFNYGVALSPAECSAAALMLDIEDEQQQGELVADHFDLEHDEAGNCYSGNIWSVIGPKITQDDEGATVTVDPEGLKRLYEMLAKCEIDQKPKWHLDLYIW